MKQMDRYAKTAMGHWPAAEDQFLTLFNGVVAVGDPGPVLGRAAALLKEADPNEAKDVTRLFKLIYWRVDLA